MINFCACPTAEKIEYGGSGSDNADDQSDGRDKEPLGVISDYDGEESNYEEKLQRFLYWGRPRNRRR